MLALFITFGVLLLLVSLAFLLYPSIRRSYLKHHYVKAYGRGVYSVANNLDFYLINRLILEAPDDSKIKVDHLLFGDKYIYVIKDYFLYGALEGKEVDHSFIFYSMNKKDNLKSYLDNLLVENDKRIEKLAMITGNKKTFFMNIVILNNDCDISRLQVENKNRFIIHRKDLKKVVETLEAKDIAPLEKTKLSYLVHDLAKLNLRDK